MSELNIKIKTLISPCLQYGLRDEIEKMASPYVGNRYQSQLAERINIEANRIAKRMQGTRDPRDGWPALMNILNKLEVV